MVLNFLSMPVWEALRELMKVEVLSFARKSFWFCAYDEHMMFQWNIVIFLVWQ